MEGAEPGYVLDKAVIIEKKSIKEASGIVQERIEECFKRIGEGWGRPIDKIYIGKSFISTRKEETFDPSKPATWKLDGIDGRYQDHIKKDYGRNGLIVVAVVTEESIPRQCKEDECITHQEEYALMLEKRLIERFQKDPTALQGAKLVNDPHYTPGKMGKKKSVAYVVYMAFTIKSKII